jgi:cystathionine beta-lyase/cystathionine gamma-synthase
MDAIIKLLKSGDEVLGTHDLYGGSYRLLVRVFSQFGIKSRFVPMQDPDYFASQISDQTKLIWIETPTNPLLQIIDIEAIVKIAKQKNILVCVDNTFASPYLQNPIDLGADLVLHSGTKYLGGHSDVIHGAVICKTNELADQLHFIQNATGAVPGPMDCFLILRGIKTLHVRVQRACENAAKVAEFLQSHSKVNRVLYPGIPTHPGHDVAKRQMRDFGAMISFDLHNQDLDAAKSVLSHTELFLCAESLGGVESLIGHPASMTHGSIPREDRIKSGLTDSLIRLSIGIEDVEDLIADLDQAIN